MATRWWRAVRLRRRCARLVRGIAVPVPFDAEELCRQVAVRVGRPVHLVAAALPDGGACGLLLSTGTAHFVCYDDRTGAVHQRHIIAHELGHLLAGHESGTLAPEVARALLPTLDPAMVARALARTPGYDRVAEVEAETIAGLLLRRAYPPPAERTWQVPPEAAPVVDRIGRSLGAGPPLPPAADGAAPGPGG